MRARATPIGVTLSPLSDLERTSRHSDGFAALASCRYSVQRVRPARAASRGSELRQAPRAVVANQVISFARAVWLSSVTDQLRGIPANLVEVGAIRRNPAIARAAGLVAGTKRSSGETASQHNPMGLPARQSPRAGRW